MDIHRTLDRLVEFDERSKNFRAADGITTDLFRSYTWSCTQYNDQGREGACVGFAWSHELSARPKVHLTDAATAQSIFHRARVLDQWPGEDYEGTSVLAGIKAAMEIINVDGLPLYGGYRWAFGLQDLAKVVGYRGPVVLGIDWYTNMYYPDGNGFISASGEVAGGHAILCNGVRIVKKNALLPATWDNVDLDKSYARLHNSWGTGYGKGGDAFITFTDLNILLENNGEACIPTLRRV